MGEILELILQLAVSFTLGLFEAVIIFLFIGLFIAFIGDVIDKRKGK